MIVSHDYALCKHVRYSYLNWCQWLQASCRNSGQEVFRQTYCSNCSLPTEADRARSFCLLHRHSVSMLTESCFYTANDTVCEINSNQQAGFSLFDLSQSLLWDPHAHFTRLMGPFTIAGMSEVAVLRPDHRLWTFPDSFWPSNERTCWSISKVSIWPGCCRWRATIVR